MTRPIKKLLVANRGEEAMKMETTITAPTAGKVRALHLHAGELVEQGDLVVEME